jgi:hypothetical protein
MRRRPIPATKPNHADPDAADADRIHLAGASQGAFAAPPRQQLVHQKRHRHELHSGAVRPQSPLPAADRALLQLLADFIGRSAAQQSIVGVPRAQLLLHRRKRRSDVGRFHGTGRRYR